MNNFYSVEDLANELQVTTRTIRNYLKAGELTGTKIGGQWRFSKEDLEKFLGTSFEDPLLRFTTDAAETDTEKSSLVIDFAYQDNQNLEAIKKTVIAEFNSLYQGQERHFYFQRLNETYARFTLVGNLHYVLTFGTWIKGQLAANRS